MSGRRSFLAGALRVLAVAALVTLAWVAGLSLRAGRLPFAGAAESGYRPAGGITAGEEVVFVFIGASFCGACQDPQLPPLVEKAKLLAHARAKASGQGFRAVAVSVDWDHRRGLELLERFGRWDQVMVGSNWLNEGAVKYIWRDVPGRPTIPQVLLLRRDVSPGESAIQVSGERLDRRLVGKDEISGWIEARTASAPAP